VPTVRRAETRDADAVLVLLEGLGRPEVAEDPSAQRAVFLDHLGYDDATIFVAEEDGIVAGIASLWLRPRLNWVTLEAWVPDLFVDAAYRRLGLGRALLEACAAEARRRGCHRLTLASRHHRKEAHLLYEALGFVEAGRHYVLEL
jgi:ribosomal protein S18 acetylase RimI-like enzyme